MTELNLDQLEDLRDRVDYDDIRPYYGGRGMYGDTCIAYVGDDPIMFAFHLAVVLCDQPAEDVSLDDFERVLSGLGAMSSDSLGMGTVWYWQGVTVAPGAHGDDEDEE
jgi:hypothetical protein